MNIDRKELGEYSVLVSDAAGECVCHAARELALYIKKATGVTLPVSAAAAGKAFCVGKTERLSAADYEQHIEQTHDDGFCVLVCDADVHILSHSERGVLYGVYDVIERMLGVRFLTADCEYVPKVRSIAPYTYFSNPDFAMRTYLVGDTFRDTADYAFMAKTRVKDLFTPVPAKFGGGVPVYGRDVHNFHCYVPFEVYGNDHPEFYRFMYVNNEILPTIDITNGITDDGLLDESAPLSVAKIVIEEMKKDLIARPDVTVLTFTQEDGNYFYVGERCNRLAERYKRSGILIRFCNAVVRALNGMSAEFFGGRRIRLMTFVYDYAKEAPVCERDGKIVPIDDTVIADENLIVQFALFSNAAYDYFSARQYPHIRKTMTEWRTVARDFWFWGYDTSFHRYLAYFDSFGNIERNVRGFKEYGISYLCIQGSHDSTTNWQCNMRAYAYRKLMWNTKLCADELLREYTELYYGIAAPYVCETMRRFHENNVRLAAAGALITVESFGNMEKAENCSAEFLRGVIAVLQEGERAVRDSALSAAKKNRLIKRLAQVKATPLSLLYDNFYDYFPDASDEQYARAEEEFFAAAESGGVDTVGERWSLSRYRQEGSASAIRRNEKKEEEKL